MAAKRMSIDDTSSLPPPRTRPSITAIVAFGIVRNRSTIAWKNPSVSFGSLRSSRGRPRIRLTSACAMKNSSSADDSTSTFASASSSTARPRRSSSSISGRSSRLIGGWSMTRAHHADRRGHSHRVEIVVRHGGKLDTKHGRRRHRSGSRSQQFQRWLDDAVPSRCPSPPPWCSPPPTRSAARRPATCC